MGDTSTTLHEDRNLLTQETLENHRAIVSLMEEFEAIDWYSQRIDATDDPQLGAILRHNRDEETEHAAMALEWLRRHDSALDAQLRTYLFTEGDICSAEAGAATDGAGPGDGSLGVDSLREVQ